MFSKNSVFVTRNQSRHVVEIPDWRRLMEVPCSESSNHQPTSTQVFWLISWLFWQGRVGLYKWKLEVLLLLSVLLIGLVNLRVVQYLCKKSAWITFSSTSRADKSTPTFSRVHSYSHLTFVHIITNIVQTHVNPIASSKKKSLWSSFIIRLLLAGGWTYPSETYARQIGSFPQGSGWKFKKNMWVATTQNIYHKPNLAIHKIHISPPNHFSPLVTTPITNHRWPSGSVIFQVPKLWSSTYYRCPVSS